MLSKTKLKWSWSTYLLIIAGILTTELVFSAFGEKDLLETICKVLLTIAGGVIALYSGKHLWQGFKGGVWDFKHSNLVYELVITGVFVWTIATLYQWNTFAGALLCTGVVLDLMYKCIAWYKTREV